MPIIPNNVTSILDEYFEQNPVKETEEEVVEEVQEEPINTEENTIEDVMNGRLLVGIQSSWNLPSIEQGKLGVCAMKCGTEFDPFAEQFK